MKALTAAGSRSFGRIVNIFKHMGDMGYDTYRTLYDTYVLPVVNYAAAVWGFADHPAPQVLQNRIGRFFLGVHRFAPLVATWTEMNLVSMKKSRWIEMLRLFNRIVNMKPNRLPKLILASDLKAGAKGWLGDLMVVAHKLHLQ